jgi:hypothetical protein
VSHFCERCDKEFGYGDTLEDFEGITICTKCKEWLDEHNKVDGRLRITRCKCCKHITKVEWQVYQKRGRKKGGHNKPKGPSSKSIFDFKRRKKNENNQ